MPFDTLYKKDSSGRIRIWEIRVEPHEGDSFIIKTRTGLEDGTINEPAGKIVDTGRQNRTIRDQANSEAQSKWMKKLDEGYKISRAAASTEIVVLPMKAQSFSKAARHIEYPAAGQRKFDGVRCMAMEATGFPSNIALLTRKNKEFAGLNQLRAEIALLNLPPSIVLDGELFSETLTFQRVTGLVRKFPENLTEQDYADLDQVSYRIYDLINLSNPTMPFVGRYRLLQSLLNAVPSANRPRLILTRNVRINNEGDVVRWLGQFEREGYEGLMVRNLESPYELDKRSKHLQKVKTFIDAEFPIVGYYEATGNDRGTPVWECEAPNGRRFRARPMGTLEERRELWANRDAMIGRPLTVRFFEYTDDGVPRFPVGVTIRDYEGEDTEELNAEGDAVADDAGVLDEIVAIIKMGNRSGWPTGKMYEYIVETLEENGWLWNGEDDEIFEANWGGMNLASSLEEMLNQARGNKEEKEAEAPLADESITAPYELKIYVPSTSDYGEWIGSEEFKSRVEEVQAFLSNIYGGFTSLSGSGGYVSDIYDLIEEPVVVVSAFASNEDYEKTLSSLEDFLREKQTEWGQEVIGFEFENDYFMYPLFETSRGTTTESFAASEPDGSLCEFNNPMSKNEEFCIYPDCENTYCVMARKTAWDAESFAMENEQIKTWYEVKYQEFPTSDLELLLRTDELESALDEAAKLLSGNLYRVEVYRMARYTTSQNVLINTQLIFAAKYDYWTSNVPSESELMATISRRFPERRRM